MFKVVFFVCVALLLFCFALQYDDELSPEAESLVARFSDDQSSTAYLHLLGISAPVGDDPVLSGESLLKASRSSDKPSDAYGYSDSEKLSLPSGDGFCVFGVDDCIGYLFSGSVKVIDLLDHHRVLVERSGRFFQYDEYRTMMQPTENEVFPEYIYLVRAQRIKILEAIYLYKMGDVRDAIESLVTQFSTVRRANERQDNLIGKVVLLPTLSDILDVLSIILSETGLHIEEIPRLSVPEKDFGTVFAREFGVSYYGFSRLDKAPNFFEVDEKFGNAPAWLVRTLFKPNMTINALAPYYLMLEELAVLSPAEFARDVKNLDRGAPSTSVIRNLAGNALLRVEGPPLEEYVAMTHDLDVKIAMFNQIHHSKLDVRSLINLYGESEFPALENGRLCFSGPFEAKYSIRCLAVQL